MVTIFPSGDRSAHGGWPHPVAASEGDGHGAAANPLLLLLPSLLLLSPAASVVVPAALPTVPPAPDAVDGVHGAPDGQAEEGSAEGGAVRGVEERVHGGVHPAWKLSIFILTSRDTLAFLCMAGKQCTFLSDTSTGRISCLCG